ncbi:MerR family transcriptional regulator [Massilia yuzhufengensis]|uniref:DNA-binding transcriptional regulator, MerR family n=1 Tax=Massilia yuzhufengensis TaxID=1164594 RepID=A0A1I1UJ98_9BURK|nr:MerR family transcriptional regulator [Massilia yuzhufengensis]SFD68823.1 DNA-binding transcriptional regulator, MerR family [Massilia yuzhufengensis]
MNTRMDEKQGEQREVTYRSGVAARLAGLPVETLRVWERRYALSETQRSAHGQRLYTAEQVRRLGLLKQLVDLGHPIGVLTGLPVERLEEMIAPNAARANEVSRPMRALVVGDSLVRRIAASGRDGRALQVQRHCARLDQVASLPGGAELDILLVEASELDDAAVALVAAARAQLRPAATVVLYRFCGSATIRALRAEGCLVARVPAEIGELVLLCRSALAGQGLPAPDQAGEQVAPRRFDEEALATITAAGNRLSCECPRHLSDILLMVGSFERYSAQCASRNKEDARLHQELGLAAGRARVVLEQAMERLALAEGLPLPDGLQRQGKAA